MRKFFAYCLSCVLVGPLCAEETGKAESPKQPAIELLHTEIDAVGWAVDALFKYPEEDRQFIRFVYLPPYADPEWIGVVDFAMNSACGHTRLLHRADRHAGGWLLAYNLQHFATDPVQLAKLISTYDSLAVKESRFHLSNVNTAENTTTAFLAPHLQEALAVHVTDEDKSERLDVIVAHMTNSPGAIYPADFLIEQLLTSVNGSYPEFRQMEFTVDEFTPFSVLLRKRGFFLEQSKELLGEKGALILSSRVTGKNRIVLAVHGLTNRLPLLVTFDINDNRKRADQQFIRSFLAFEPNTDASEAFIPLQNGLLEYVLTDSKGNLQRAAPSNIVADSTKPDGFTKELEMGMSCIICHSPDDGYKTARNDMEFLLGSDADYLGDEITFHGKTLTREEAVDIVAGRYGEPIDDPDGILGRARRDFIKAVDVLTDYEVTADGESSVVKLGRKLKQIYHGYRYQLIGAQQACLALGVRVNDPSLARQVLNTLVPKLPDGTQDDILIPMLKNGAEIKRDDMDAIFVELARRAAANRKNLVGAQ